MTWFIHVFCLSLLSYLLHCIYLPDCKVNVGMNQFLYFTELKEVKITDLILIVESHRQTASRFSVNTLVSHTLSIDLSFDPSYMVDIQNPLSTFCSFMSGSFSMLIHQINWICQSKFEPQEFDFHLFFLISFPHWHKICLFTERLVKLSPNTSTH